MSGGEFARLVKLDRLPDKLTITAEEPERAALAARFGLPAIAHLQARVTLAREGATVEARGRFEAAFTQRCAVSDEPFANRVEETIAINFVPALATVSEDEELEFDPAAPDEIAYEGNAFDLGEAVAETFGLVIDPYARGPEADAARRAAGLTDEDAPSGPFAALAALRPQS